MSLSVSLCVSLCLSVSLCVSLCLWVSLCVYVNLSISLYVFLCLSVSLSALPVSFSPVMFSPSLFVSLPLSRSLSRPPSFSSSLSLFYFQSFSSSVVKIPTRRRSRLYIYLFSDPDEVEFNNSQSMRVFSVLSKKNSALLYFFVHDPRRTFEERCFFEIYSLER